MKHDPNWLKEQIKTVKETIRLRWVDMAEAPSTPDERAALRAEIDNLNQQLASLRENLVAADG